MLEVYTWEPIANSGKPLLMLPEKGVPFTHHYIDFAQRQQHSPEYLAINPNGTVPAIVHDGQVLTESSQALEYLDEVLDGPPLRPADPGQRSRMRWWIRYMDGNICPAMAMVGSNRAYRARGGQASADEVTQAVGRIPLPERQRTWTLLMSGQIPAEALQESERRIRAAFCLYDDALAVAPYLAGPDFSLADIVTLSTVGNIHIDWAADVNEAATPHLLDWLRRCHDRPGIRAGFAMGGERFAGRARDARQHLGLKA